jgi:hypothetical protein
MTGGLYQIVNTGTQNMFLTENAEISFFKSSYKRHTMFAIESMENTFNGSVGFGNKITCTISHNADLIWKTYLEVEVSAMTASSGHVAWVKNLGYSMIERVEVEIGGQIIDYHTGKFLNLMKELNCPLGHVDTLDNMIGNVAEMNDLTNPATTSTPARKLYIPLDFWFCKSPGQALPIVALTHQDIKINVWFKKASELYTGTPTSTPTITSAALFCDYIYLTQDERNKFSTATLEYLIDQVQYLDESISQSNYRSRLTFNHPVQDLIWTVQPTANITANDITNYTNAGGHTVNTVELQLNGQPRFVKREANIFNWIQPWQHYYKGPSTGIYCYSFALKPDEYMPNGSCNFSKIDNATLLLNLTTTDATLNIYARNKNVLRVRRGMAGIAYAS